MPAVRGGHVRAHADASGRSTKLSYKTMSHGSREIIILSDSSDDGHGGKSPPPPPRQRRARSHSTASSINALPVVSTPESTGRRRSARQAGKDARSSAKLVDAPSSVTAQSRTKVSAQAAASKLTAKKPAGGPSNGAPSQRRAGKGRLVDPRSSPPPASVPASTTAPTPSPKALEEPTPNPRHAEELQQLRDEAALLRVRVRELEAEKENASAEKRAVALTIDNMEDYLTCGICMDIHLRPFTLQPCGHNCCIRCLHPWLGTHDTCPLCAVAVQRAFPNSDMNALAELYVEAHPEKKHAQADSNEAETLLMLSKENSANPPFAQLLPKHAQEQQDAGAGAVRPPIDHWLEAERQLHQARADFLRHGGVDNDDLEIRPRINLQPQLQALQPQRPAGPAAARAGHGNNAVARPVNAVGAFFDLGVLFGR